MQNEHRENNSQMRQNDMIHKIQNSEDLHELSGCRNHAEINSNMLTQYSSGKTTSAHEKFLKEKRKPTK